MTNEERQSKIKSIVDQINYIYPEWVFLGVKIKSGTFVDTKDELTIVSKWNELDNKQADLYKVLSALQTHYEVQYYDREGLLIMAELTLHRKVDLDTVKNGWNTYENNLEVRELLKDCFQIMNWTIGPVEIKHLRML
jgi:hypothetical protein